jgi:SPP1 family phage portal protein
MQIQKTDKTTLTPDEILTYMDEYEKSQVGEFAKLWEYFLGDDRAVLSRTPSDPNNPNNKIPIPYGRKIITTFTGYAYRPRYITYKAVTVDDAPEEPKPSPKPPAPGEKAPPEPPKPPTAEEQYVKQLQATFNANNEHIKTSRAGRNSGIFGVAYELLYIDGVVDEQTLKAEARFFSVDPREMILLYDYSSEPKKVMAIRFYAITKNWFKVEVYYADKIIVYDRKREEQSNKWTLTLVSEAINFFGEVPVIAYYFGDEMIGIIKPILPLIDAYDTLVSDSMNEYDKFAAAYLIMKNFGITDPTKKKEPGVVALALQLMKRRRLIEHVPKDAEIEYLTKDIPTAFIEFMSDFIRDQIHVQSHVPDFTGEKMSGASGIAIQRLLFDFENVVSSAEADFDTGLMERIRLINLFYAKAKRLVGTPEMISISHKRNVPLDIKQFADTALTMKNAGFSRYLVADIMPDDIVPDVDEELKRQDEDSAALMPNLDNVPPPDENMDAQGNPMDKAQMDKSQMPVGGNGK